MMGHLSGGTRLTHDLCGLVNRPCVLISAREDTGSDCGCQGGLEVHDDNRIETLNVAGPRASRWVGGYSYAADVVSGVIFRLATGLRRDEAVDDSPAGGSIPRA